MGKIDETCERGVLVLAPAGRLDADTSPALEARLGAVDDEANGIILDLGATEYISSAGLRVILAAARQNMGAGRPFVLCRLLPAVMEVFHMTGFHHILTIQPDLEAAMKRIVPGSP